MATTPHTIHLIEEAYQTKATFLDLGNCGLTDVPAELEKLAPYLVSLNLGAFYRDTTGIFIDSPYKVAPNNLNKGDWSRLMTLKKLRSLFVTQTSLTAVDAKVLAKLVGLTDLFMGSNSIGDEGAQAIVQLQDLITLDLGSNGVSQRGIQALAQLREITTLYLSWNSIGDDGVGVLTGLDGLISLDLGNNGLGPLGAQRLSKLHSLTSLNLYRNKIGAGGMQALSELTSLTSLNISGNNIGSDGAIWLAQLNDLTSLDVSNNDIGDKGAQAVGQLAKLNSLNINRNKIKADGAGELTQLINLTTLNAGDNNLGNEGISSAIATLMNLTDLNVSDNQIGDEGAIALAQLNNLTYLNVQKNQIGLAGAVALAQLQKLTSLTVSANQLGDEGAVTLAQLGHLTNLDIASNKIGPVGARGLTQLRELTNLNIADNQLGEQGAETLLAFTNLVVLNISENNLGDKGAQALARLKNLKRLNLRRNEIKDFPIEEYRRLLLHSLQELLISENPFQNISLSDLNNIQALKGLVESLRVEETGPSRHLKISLLGDGFAGKTSFADYLIEKKYQSTSTKRTHGILQYQWKLSNEFEAQIWDFGGQDYYHGTHHLFLREENIFLVFWHPDENLADERSRYCYWLGNTRYFTRESTVFLIQTKGDLTTKVQVTPEDLLNYAVKPENVFCISVQGAFNKLPAEERNWNFLVNILEDSARQLAEKRQINSNWATIRERLCADSNKEFYLDEDQFRKKHFPGGSLNELAALLSYLEFSGTILRFQQIESLQKRLYLDPKGLTESIYQVFDQTVRAKGGHFDYEHLKKKVGQEADAYLELMIAYDLIFESPMQPNTYVVPQYLPDYSNTFGLQTLEQTIQLSFALYYPDYLHQGMIFTFIAQYGRLAINSEFWRYGLLFEDPETQTKCLVRCDLPARKIYIHLNDTRDKLKLAARLFDYFAGTGETNSYQRAHTKPSPLLQPELDGIRRDWNRMPPRLAISIDGKQFMDVREVHENINNGIFWGFTLNERKRLPLNAILHYLLNNDSTSTIPKKIFFSYSHKDEVYKQELDAHLSTLKRGGKIEAWHDRKILPGEDWDETILEQVKSADIVLLLLSADFMNSDYIWKKEIRAAIEQHALKDISIVPIFLRPCDFDSTELRTKQGLPRDARWIVSNDRSNRDEGYLQVVKELKVLL